MNSYLDNYIKANLGALYALVKKITFINNNLFHFHS